MLYFCFNANFLVSYGQFPIRSIRFVSAQIPIYCHRWAHPQRLMHWYLLDVLKIIFAHKNKFPTIPYSNWSDYRKLGWWEYWELTKRQRPNETQWCWSSLWVVTVCTLLSKPKCYFCESFKSDDRMSCLHAICWVQTVSYFQLIWLTGQAVTYGSANTLVKPVSAFLKHELLREFLF